MNGDGSATDRVPELDGIRGTAILLVLLFHLASPSWQPLWLLRPFYAIARLGWAGVDLFFVLSGFLITSILIAAKGERYALRDFYARRALRIFPLYYTVLIVVLVILPLVLPRTDAVERVLSNQYSFWLPLANNYGPADGGFITLDHFWSLSVEEQFYFGWSLIVFFVSLRNAERIAIATIVTAPLLRIGVALAAQRSLIDFVHAAHLVRFATVCRMDAIAIGCWIALRRARGEPPERWLPYPRTVLSTALGAIVAAAASGTATRVLVRTDPLTAITTPLFLSAVPLFFAAVLVLAVTSRWRVMRFRGLRVLGKWSYALYVIQGVLSPLLVPDRIVRAILPYVRFWDLAGFLAFAAAASVSIALAAMSYHLLELPFLRMQRRFRSHRAAEALMTS